MDTVKDKPMRHPADESRIDQIVHGWIPLVAALLVLAVSVAMDVTRTQAQNHWTQRAGSIVTVLGANVAHRDARQATKFIAGDFYINNQLPYRMISVVMVVLETFVWGYADLVL